MASRTIARSVTVRASGPPTSCDSASGMMPLRLDSPIVGRSPTRLLWAEGYRIDPHVSVPIPNDAKLAAIAAPVPPLEPPGFREGSYGLRVCPPRELMVVMPRANSCRLVLPTITAPALRSLPTWKASRSGIDPFRAMDPAVVGMSAVS